MSDNNDNDDHDDALVPVQEPQVEHQEPPQDEGSEDADEMTIKFALSPVRAWLGLFDMSNAEGHKMYFKAVQPVSETELCDCQLDGLKAFLDDLAECAVDHGWNNTTHGVMQIPKNS